MMNKNHKYDIKNAFEKIFLESEKKPRKFNESFEIIVNLFLGEKDEVLRGSFELPKQMNKTKTICVFADESSETFSLCKDAGADHVGMEDVITDIMSKKINYDIYLASASQMSKLKKIASKLGPRNKMPNSKVGTLTDNPEKVISKMKNKTCFFKSLKGCVQTIIGDLKMNQEDLIENAKFVTANLVEQFKNSNPTKDAIKSIYIKTTMGKSFLIDEKTLLN